MDKTPYISVVKSDARDTLQVELFDTKQIEAYPQLKVMRWGNEVNLSIRLVESSRSTQSVTTQDGKIIYSSPGVECQFKHVAPCGLHPEGAIDFDTVLLEEPVNNEVVFSIVGKGIEFLYQAPFTDLVKPGEFYEGWLVESVTDKEIYGPKGQLIASRERDDNVGSYAVYYRNHPANIKGGKQYKVGKLGHIYYPYIIDSEGNSIRASSFVIEYDKSSDTGICKIGIPKGIKYPAMLDPTIGFTGEGTSGGVPSESIWASGYNITTDASGGVVSSIFYSAKKVSADAYAIAGLYTTEETRALLSPQSASVLINSTTKQWWEFVFSNGPTLAANTAYFPCVLPDVVSNGIYRYYDSGGDSGDGRYWTSQTYPNWPSTLAAGSASGNRYSIYAEYESGSPPATSWGGTWGG